ncbi:Inhibitory regulator protein IRA2 [Nakaseomyces bracarensis]|uniref:Inhibitory regulator protein IRA2 n=1 Tax=Nakaseomyces bracarensis TaxID=273131 RepID=A0ABR4NP51_9SACH
MSSIDPQMPRPYMIQSMVNYLFFSRLLPLLPVESTATTHTEVEAEPFYLSIRSVLMKIAVFKDLNTVIENALNLLETILDDEDIISGRIKPDAIQSTLVVVRLLSDILEFYWQFDEQKSKDNRDDMNSNIDVFEIGKFASKSFNPNTSSTESKEWQKKQQNMSSFFVGYSTSKTCYHQSPPKKLDGNVTSRLIYTCARLKFNTQTLVVLRNIEKHSVEAHQPNTLDHYDAYLKANKHPEYCKLMDTTIGHIVKFIAASNPREYLKFLETNIQNLLQENAVEAEPYIIEYLDLFSFAYITKDFLPTYLKKVSVVLHALRNPVYKCVLLFFASESMVFWIMLRPRDFMGIYTLVESHHTGTTHLEINKSTSTTANELFEEIYSMFNVSSILSSTQNINILSSIRQGERSISPIQIETGDRNRTNRNSFVNTESRSSSRASPETTLEIPTPISNFGDAFQDIANVASTKSSSVTLNASELLKNYPTTNRLSTPSNSSSSSNKSKSFNPFVDFDDVKLAAEATRPEVPHLDNILDLYTIHDHSISLPHSSVLRFLTTLVMLDTEAFTELNSMPFKYLTDVNKLSKGSATASTFYSRGESPKEKEKSPSIKQLSNSWKKLTNLQLSKKKTVKFLKSLIKNLNGLQYVSDNALLDTVGALLCLMNMTSAISLLEPSLPSVLFARRLLGVLGNNLKVGDNWDGKLNTSLIECLQRYPKIHGRFSLSFFSSSIRFDWDSFLSHLNAESTITASDLKKLNLYTEGFRVFFHLPNTKSLLQSVTERTSDFFKVLFSGTADILLTEHPYFEDKVSDIVNSILDGTILDEFGTRKHSTGSTTSESSSVRSFSPSQRSFTPGISPSFSEIEHSAHAFIPASSASPLLSDSENSRSVEMSSNSDSQISHLLAPRPHHLPPTSSNLRNAVLSTIPNKDKSHSNEKGARAESSSNIAAALMTVTTSTPSIQSPSMKSPFQKSKQRRYSDEAARKFLKLNLGNVSNSALVDDELAQNPDAKYIMTSIFSIFKRLTRYFIVPHDQNSKSSWVSKDFRNIIKPIFVAFISADENLQSKAKSFMNVLIDFVTEFSDSTEPLTMQGYHLICSYTIILFSVGLFDLKLETKKRENLLDIAVQFMRVRSHLGLTAEKTNQINIIKDIECATFPMILGIVARGLFVSLYCSKPSIQKTLKVAFGEFLSLLQFHDKYAEEHEKNWIDNVKFIKAIASDTHSTSGSVAFQRRVRSSILKCLKYPDSILMDSFKMIYRKWYSLSIISGHSHEELNDFRSFAGIIAALSGILFSSNKSLRENFTYIETMKTELKKDLDYFVSMQCQWLNNVDLLTRENSKDILSLELHPLAFKYLFKNLRIRLNELSDLDLSQPEQELNFVLLEQIIIILRTILNREDEEKSMLLFSSEIVNFIKDLCDMVEKIPHDSPKYYKAIIQMSKMIRAMNHAQGTLAIINHYQLKNEWLRTVTNWFKLTISKNYDFDNLSKPHREMDLKTRDLDILYIDTAIESSNAIAYLTENLPLETPPSTSIEELKKSQALIFGHYFNILLKGLEKTKDPERFPPSLKHKMSVFTDNIILSLTNLSNRNVEASLQFTLPMGYSKNKNIRLAFLKVFINTVSNSELSPSKSHQVKLIAMDKLLQFAISHPNLSLIAAAKCPANDLDAYAADLVDGFNTRNAAHIAVSQLISAEIEQSSRSTDILRRNSVATRALSMLARIKGNTYLVYTIKPILLALINNQEAFEVEKIKPAGQSYERDVILFKKYMTKILDSINASISSMPAELFYICQTIYLNVKEKFPDYALVAVGSCIFLRFICPALVSPESENLINVMTIKEKRSFIFLAKVIQNIANGSDNYVKWEALKNETEFFADCKKRIFTFLREVSRPDRKINIPIRTDPTPISFDFGFLHSFLYQNGLVIRQFLLTRHEDSDNFEFLKNTILLVDSLLGELGPPKIQYTSGLPVFVRDNAATYPQLYDFMSRYAFKNAHSLQGTTHYVQESMSAEGIPTITLLLGNFSNGEVETEILAYKFFKIYSRIWTVKHYLILDCTKFNNQRTDTKKFATMLCTLVPDVCVMNCIGFYYFNVNEQFMDVYADFFREENPYLIPQIPHHFINSSTDEKLIKTLGIGNEGLEIVHDVRISLHEISLYNEDKKRFTPVLLKMGNRYFQVLHETPRHYKIDEINSLVSIRFNDVYDINQLSSIHVSSTTGIMKEFTVAFLNGERLIFSSSKYLEIVKMFSSAQSRLENEYIINSSAVSINSKVALTIEREKENLSDNKKIVCHILLISLVGLFDEDNLVKNYSYNLLAAAERAFHLDLGTHFHKSPEIYVPDDTTTFLCVISESLSHNSAELTRYIWDYFLDGLENGILPHHMVPQTICALSYWTHNLYEHVYLEDPEEGLEAISRIFRSLIRLTIDEPDFITIYVQQIWCLIIIDGKLSDILVNEVINHALERDSENRDWSKTIHLLTALPTVEIAGCVIKKLISKIRGFLPSLRIEALTQSWSELKILVKISIHLFFETPLLAQMFLPEVLFIISLLIDVGPIELRNSLHGLLMNVCYSLSMNIALAESERSHLEEITRIFSTEKSKFMFGFGQEKGSLLQSFTTTSVSSKFNILECFITNVLALMDYGATIESGQWKSQYKKYLMSFVFNGDSFLSARAIMIVGIVGKTDASLPLCRNLLGETIKVSSIPVVNEETTFLLIAHIFAYSKVVDGLHPTSPLIRKMFWFSTVFLESKHPILFESGLLLLTMCFRKLYVYRFDDNSKVGPIIPLLMGERKFAARFLSEIDGTYGITWSDNNFTHIIISFVIRGFSIPFIRSNAIAFLTMQFRHNYFESLIDKSVKEYFPYLTLLYLLFSTEQFLEVLEDVDFDSEYVYLDQHTKIPEIVLEWLSENSESAQVTLFQCAVLFSSTVTDEPFKLRFSLILEWLLNKNPSTVFSFYALIRQELKRISSFERVSDCGPVIFEIIRLLVLHPEFEKLDDFYEETLKKLEERGLSFIAKVDSLEQDSKFLVSAFFESPEVIYKRKRLTTQIVAVLISSTY